MLKDYVYCQRCGEEYNRLHPEGHECDPQILEALAQEAQNDQEVRDREADEE